MQVVSGRPSSRAVYHRGRGQDPVTVVGRTMSFVAVNTVRSLYARFGSIRGMASETADDRAHHRRRQSGRDPLEEHRASTPLELLFDLTFAVAFGVAANELAHYVGEDHVWSGIAGFCFACFAVAWAWINYSWFASAYDTDDWVMRLATMVQMVGVI